MLVKYFKPIFSYFPVVIISLILLTSCQSKKEDPSVELSYKKAMNLLTERRYIEASESFEQLIDDYPLSKWSKNAQVMAAYAFYKYENYDDTVRLVDDFVINNPANQDVPYMLYLKGRSYYDRMPNINRAQNDTQIASYTFRELAARFPTSKYTKDARTKLTTVDQHLAGAKMSVGRYEMTTGNYVGAIQHFNQVIKRYHATDQVPEAYFRLAEIYTAIGMQDQANEAKKVLTTKYKDSNWAVQKL